MIPPLPPPAPASSTPGPWTVVSQARDHLWIMAEDGSQDGRVIVSTPVRRDPSARLVADRAKPPTDEDRANAHLIAAAPLLYTELEAAVRLLEDCLGKPEVARRGREALARARGETS